MSMHYAGILKGCKKIVFRYKKCNFLRSQYNLADDSESDSNDVDIAGCEFC